MSIELTLRESNNRLLKIFSELRVQLEEVIEQMENGTPQRAQQIARELHKEILWWEDGFCNRLAAGDRPLPTQDGDQAQVAPGRQPSRRAGPAGHLCPPAQSPTG